MQLCVAQDSSCENLIKMPEWNLELCLAKNSNTNRDFGMLKIFQRRKALDGGRITREASLYGKHYSGLKIKKLWELENQYSDNSNLKVLRDTLFEQNNNKCYIQKIRTKNLESLAFYETVTIGIVVYQSQYMVYVALGSESPSEVINATIDGNDSYEIVFDLIKKSKFSGDNIIENIDEEKTKFLNNVSKAVDGKKSIKDLLPDKEILKDNVFELSEEEFSEYIQQREVFIKEYIRIINGFENLEIVSSDLYPTDQMFAEEVQLYVGHLVLKLEHEIYKTKILSFRYKGKFYLMSLK